MFILIIVIPYTLSCDTIFYSENEIKIPLTNKGILVARENNENTQLSSDDINFTFLNHVHTIDAESTIKLQLIELQFSMHLCFLILDIKYKIHCKEGFKNYPIDGKYDYTYGKDYSIELQTEKEDSCENFEYQESSFLIVCFTNSSFKLINQTNTIIEYNHNIPKSCIRNVIFRKEIIFISFYLCSEWVVYEIFNFTVSVKSNKSIQETNEQLKDVSVCTHERLDLLYLLFENFYTKHESNNDQIYYLSDPIPFIIFSQSCEVFVHVIDTKGNQTELKIYQTYNLIVSKMYFDTGEKLKQGLLTNSYLILFYQNSVSIILTKKIHQTFNFSLEEFIFLNSNYFVGVDSKTKKILFFQLQSYNENLKHPKSQFLMEFYPDLYESDHYPKSCIEVKIINSTDLVVYNRMTQIEHRNDQNNETVIVLKSMLFSSVPVEWFTLSMTDLQNLSDICNFRAEFYQKEENLVFLESRNGKIAILQLQKELIFHNCQTGKVNRFKNIIKNANSQVLSLQNKLIVIANDSLWMFNCYDHIEIFRKIEFQDQISRIFPYKQIEILVTFEGLEKIAILNIYNLKIKDLKGLPQIPFKNQILFYFEQRNYLLVQFKNQIILFQDNQLTVTTFEEISIVFQIANPYVCLVGVHELRNEINYYCFLNRKLQLTTSPNLFDFELIRPLNYAISTQNLILAAKRKGQIYLLVFSCQESQSFRFKEAILTVNQQFSIFNRILIYFNEMGKLQFKNIEKYILTIDQICQPTQAFVNISFEGVSCIDNQKSMTAPTKLVILEACKKLVRLVNPPSIYISKNETFFLNQFIFGQVNYIKQKESTCQAEVKGPFLFSNEQYSCILFSGSICIFQNDYDQYFVKDFINEIESTHIQFKDIDQFLFALTLQKNEILIATFVLHIININYYTHNGTAFILNVQKSQFFETHSTSLGKIILRRSGQVNVIHILGYPILLIIKNKVVFGEFQELYGCQFIENSKDLFILTFKCSEIIDCILQINVMQLINDDLTGIRNLTLNLNNLSDAFKSQFDLSFTFLIQNIFIIYCEQSKDQIFLQILIQFYSLSSIRLNIVLKSEGYTLEIYQIFRSALSFTDFNQSLVDKQFSIQSSNNNFYLYDMRTFSPLIDPIFKFKEFYEIVPYNNTHYFFFRNQVLKIGRIDFEIQIKFPQSCILEIEAFNELSSIQFNITLLNQTSQDESKFLKIFVIIFILMAYLFRRKKLQERQLRLYL